MRRPACMTRSARIERFSARTILSPAQPALGEISRSIGMHPLALLTLAYLRIEQNTPEEMTAEIRSDLEALELWGPWGFESELVAGDSEES